MSSAPDAVVIARTASLLERARLDSRAVPPVRGLLGDDQVGAAYAVQRTLTERRVAAGARIVGRKIGLTSPAVQRQLGVDQPDFGVLFDDMAFANGASVPIGALLSPRVEAEIAFVLSEDITGTLIDAQSVRAAVDYAVGALEIVDSRIAGWDISIADTVADNASSALYVLGSTQLALDEFEPALIAMSMSMNGEVASTGTGADCLGDPLAALAWLARTAAELGDPLRAGQVVLAGALGPMAPLGVGDRVDADLGVLGHVSATFTGITTPQEEK